ncbi:MAG TPA: gamma-glutamylcyclotransferase [Aliiroseovarius sp.]|nr:gamma-glutamylcyclotransferase [Aliiroseovarius sp.]
MTKRHFFGYGSLVNRGTHDYAGAFPARLSGWRRAWRATPDRARCYLTVLAQPGAEIWGLVAAVPAPAQAALDAREQAYGRVRIKAGLSHEAAHSGAVELHAIPDGRHFDPGPDNPVLLSYLDTVVQGYLREFGHDGVRHFFESTDGWQAPFVDDRAAPVYPRAQVLDAGERALVDAELARIGVCTVAP